MVRFCRVGKFLKWMYKTTKAFLVSVHNVSGAACIFRVHVKAFANVKQ